MNRYNKALRILSPKGQIEDKSLLAVKVVKGEHYSRPVMKKEIQEYIKQTFEKSNQYRYREDNWLENLIGSKETEFDQKEIEKEIKLQNNNKQQLQYAHFDKKVKAAAKVKEETVKHLKSNWRRENLREFGEWVPISSGPTNSSATTFGYFVGGEQQINYDTGEPITFTYSGLGGIENYPSTITVDQGAGEVHTTDAPPFSQLGVQGYAAKLNPKYKAAQEKYKKELKEWKKKENANLKAIKDTLKSFGTSWDEMRASKKWVKKLGDGTVVAIIPTDSNPSPMNWTNNVRVVKLKQCANASGPMSINYNPPGQYQDWVVVENSEIQSEVYLQIGEQPKEPMESQYLMPRRTDFKDVNPQLDSSQEFAQKVDADYMMNARVEQPSFKDWRLAQLSFDSNNPNNPEYNKLFAPITAIDELSIVALGAAWGQITKLYPDLSWTQKLAIDYAKGNLEPRNVSPSLMYNSGVLKAIEHNLRIKSEPGSVSSYSGMNPLDMVHTATTRLSMGRFNYKATADGIQVTDVFDFDQNKHLGLFGIVFGLDQTAERIIDLGQRRAAEKGFKMVHIMTNRKTGHKEEITIIPGDRFSPDGYGIPIKFTIPWSQVSPQLQNKLDPNQTIVPIVRKRKRKKKNNSQ